MGRQVFIKLKKNIIRIVKYFSIWDIILIVSIFVLFIFYFWTYAEEGNMYLDFFTHARFAEHIWKEIMLMGKNNSGYFSAYPIWHIVYNIFYNLSGGVRCFATGTSTSFFLTFNFIILLVTFKKTIKNRFLQYFFSIGMIFIGPLSFGLINENYYLGQLTSNVWHNPTTIAAKPFVLLAYMFYITYIKKELINGEKDIKVAIAASVSLVIASLAKPSFTLVFLPAVFFFCIIEFLMYKRKALPFCLKSAAIIIPSCTILLFQYMVVFGGGNVISDYITDFNTRIHQESDYKNLDTYTISAEVIDKARLENTSKDVSKERGIGFSPFMVIKSYSKHPIGSLVISLAFPIYIFIITILQVKNKKYIFFTGCLYLFGLLPYIFLYKRDNPYSGDMVWGAHLVTYILFVLSCILLGHLKSQMVGIVSKILYDFGVVLFGLHVFFGLQYCVSVYYNHTYAAPIMINIL